VLNSYWLIIPVVTVPLFTLLYSFKCVLQTNYAIHTFSLILDLIFLTKLKLFKLT